MGQTFHLELRVNGITVPGSTTGPLSATVLGSGVFTFPAQNYPAGVGNGIMAVVLGADGLSHRLSALYVSASG